VRRDRSGRSAGLTRRAAVVAGAAAMVAGPAWAADPLAAVERQTGGRLGVAAVDLATGARLDHRPRERFPMCSTFKAMAVAAALEAVENGSERLDRFVRFGEKDLLPFSPVTRQRVADGGMAFGDLCAAAIEESDNTAANIVLASIGGPAGWTAFVRRLGDIESRLDRVEPDLNSALPKDPRDTTTPEAMAADLRATLVEGELSSESRERLRGWMVGCKTGLARLRKGLPANWIVADKTGSGENGTSNDIAVVWRPAGAIVIACYLTGARVGPDMRDAAIAAVGRIVAAALSERAPRRG